MKYFQGQIDLNSLNKNEIFVFGSNEAGIHGAGAAKAALKVGAVFGKGEGLYGQTYALPTKDNNIKTLSVDKIQKYVGNFIQCAQEHPDLMFLVTEIGCGLAGYNKHQIAPLFVQCLEMDNVKLSQDFYLICKSLRKNE